MLLYSKHMIGVFALGILFSTKIVAGRFCEGGHICSLPRECCTQGCCPPYQSGPRQLPPATDHVLNLFFISHWYFWCVVVAVILAILCAYSLWRKRRTLCGWGLSEHPAQSEGDSAGSCYAPPQYSRCSSFHHPPPPYTEVTSKPDLYPLVFTCNSDNGKNGASYLMVQYFRNYIVRPAGSLSATSTVDSLSSSFICNANEANTLVPPPYSRATSPETGGYNPHFQQHYMIPRSASQLVCANGNHDTYIGNLASQQVYQPRSSQYSTTAMGSGPGPSDAAAGTNYIGAQRRMGDSAAESGDSDNNASLLQAAAGANSDSQQTPQRMNGFVQSQSEQYFRYMANSNSSISDIFVNNSCAVDFTGTGAAGGVDHNEPAVNAALSSSSSLAVGGSGTPAIYSNGCIQTNPLLHKLAGNAKQLAEVNSNVVYNSNSSIEGISITVPVPAEGVNEYRDLNVLRRSLETCCQFLHQQQMPAAATNYASGDSPLRTHDFAKKFGEESLRSYVTSGTCSAVSSLANVGTPSSPPQATSPTGEIKDILDQIRQLQTEGANIDETLLSSRAELLYGATLPSPTNTVAFPADGQRSPLQRFPAKAGKPITGSPSPTNVKRLTHNPSAGNAGSSPTTPNAHLLSAGFSVSKRPSSLHQNKKKFFTPKPNKALYIPMTANAPPPPPANRCALKSPVSVVGANFFANRGRVRKGWISRSAPTTPGTALPPNRLGDDSPLLNEHDEDQEAEQ